MHLQYCFYCGQQFINLILKRKKCLPNSDERTCKITGNNFSVVTAIELVVEKIIEGAIQESKGEFKGTPSSQIVPYDPSKDTGETKNEKVRILRPFK